jgi:hypothetical protein
MFFAQPTGQVSILEPAGTAGQNRVPCLTDAVGGLPQSVINALQNQAFEAAMTDVRPEDALFAVNRALAQWNAAYTGLGYGPPPAGITILPSFPGPTVTPVAFAISGRDPITGEPAKNWTTVPVGADPVVVFVNSTQTSGGNGDFSNSQAFQNVNRFDLALTLNGTYAYTRDISPTSGLQAVAMNVCLREPISGVYNTIEFDNPRSVEIGSTQELGDMNPSCSPGGPPCADNPLDLVNTFSGGWRQRVIGDSNMIAQVANSANGDVLGYSFWSTQMFANEQGPLRYLAVDTSDPLFTSYSGGTLPGNCSCGCPAEVPFTNIYNGGYPIWSMLRIATFNPVRPGVQALVVGAQNWVVSTNPDFVPLEVKGNQQNLTVFRSHFHRPGQKGSTANGLIAGLPESGGDEGGAVLIDQADLDDYADTGVELLNLKQ